MNDVDLFCYRPLDRLNDPVNRGLLIDVQDSAYIEVYISSDPGHPVILFIGTDQAGHAGSMTGLVLIKRMDFGFSKKVFSLYEGNMAVCIQPGIQNSNTDPGQAFAFLVAFFRIQTFDIPLRLFADRDSGCFCLLFP